MTRLRLYVDVPSKALPL